MFFSSGKTTPHDIVEESYLSLKKMLDDQDFNNRAHYVALYVLLSSWSTLSALPQWVHNLTVHKNYPFLNDVNENIPLTITACTADSLGWLKQQACSAGAQFFGERLHEIRKHHNDQYKNIHYLIPKHFTPPSTPLKIIPTATKINYIETWELSLYPHGQRVIIGDCGILPTALAHQFANESGACFLSIPVKLIAELKPASFGELLQLYYFPDTLNPLFMVEQHLFENQLFELLKTKNIRAKSNPLIEKDRLILFLEGFEGMGCHLTPLFKELLLFPNVTLTSSAADLALLRQQGVLHNAIEIPLTGFKETDIKAYINHYFTKHDGEVAEKGAHFHSLLAKNPYLQTLLKQPEYLELACLTYETTLAEINSLSQLYNALLQQFVRTHETRQRGCLRPHSAQQIRAIIEECSETAYAAFQSNTLEVDASREQKTYGVDMGLLKSTISPATNELSFTFATPSLQAYLAAKYIHKRKLIVALPNPINFNLLLSTSRFLIHLWIDDKDKHALESFFKMVLTRSLLPGNKLNDLLLQQMWAETTFAIALRAYSAAKTPAAFLALPAELTQTIEHRLAEMENISRYLALKSYVSASANAVKNKDAHSLPQETKITPNAPRTLTKNAPCRQFR